MWWVICGVIVFLIAWAGWAVSEMLAEEEGQEDYYDDIPPAAGMGGAC